MMKKYFIENPPLLYSIAQYMATVAEYSQPLYSHTHNTPATAVDYLQLPQDSCWRLTGCLCCQCSRPQPGVAAGMQVVGSCGESRVRTEFCTVGVAHQPHQVLDKHTQVQVSQITNKTKHRIISRKGYFMKTNILSQYFMPDKNITLITYKCTCLVKNFTTKQFFF